MYDKLKTISLMSIALFCLQATQSSGQVSRSSGAEVQYTADGADSCLRCHGVERMTTMAETAHGNANNPHAPYAQQGCESCHGPGSLHVSRARGGAGFPALIRFGDEATHDQQKTACLNCHAQDMGELEGMEWAGRLHDTPQVTCSTCHQVHSTENPLANREDQISTCAHCHEDEISNHQRFEQQGIVFDRLTCNDCHDVHQLTRRDEANASTR